MVVRVLSQAVEWFQRYLRRRSEQQRSQSNDGSLGPKRAPVRWVQRGSVASSTSFSTSLHRRWWSSSGRRLFAPDVMFDLCPMDVWQCPRKSHRSCSTSQWSLRSSSIVIDRSTSLRASLSNGWFSWISHLPSTDCSSLSSESETRHQELDFVDEKISREVIDVIAICLPWDERSLLANGCNMADTEEKYETLDELNRLSLCEERWEKRKDKLIVEKVEQCHPNCLSCRSLLLLFV